MHREFKKLLKDATGISEFVIAVNLDVRRFSAFSTKEESPAVAEFIKKIYTKLISNYFSEASFFKPTGDGLLIIIPIMPYTERKLGNVTRNTIDSCLKVVRDFGSFCENDSKINFEVPEKVGMGLSRGPACRLFSKGKTLDYSGRVLNLASRLMDFARPRGVVFDAAFGIELLSEEQIKKFAKESIYIKGIAEEEPMDVFYTKDLTVIPAESKSPLKQEIKWNSVTDNSNLKEIKELGPSFLYRLPSKPVDSNDIQVKVTHPCIIKGRKRKGVVSTFSFSDFRYFLEAEQPIVQLSFDALAKRLETNKVKNHFDVKIEIMYPEKTEKQVKDESSAV